MTQSRQSRCASSKQMVDPDREQTEGNQTRQVAAELPNPLMIVVLPDLDDEDGSTDHERQQGKQSEQSIGVQKI